MIAGGSADAEALRSDPNYRAIKDALVARTGHYYYQDKDDLLWERLRRRLVATHCDGLGAYLGLLMAESEAGEAEWRRLEADITIGETYFFRYAEQFAAMREHILPQVIADRATDRRLRIWSAGCSTGAEAYSVAILVSELLGDRLPDWRVTILGTDLSEAALEKARKAVYGFWALRTVTPEQRRLYFERQDPSSWRLRNRYRSLVRFQQHNLVSLLQPTGPLQFSDFDLILCRNVLIYFHPDQGLQIVRSLRDRLSETGWLLLGHADANPWHAELMSVQTFDGAVAYRKRPETEAALIAPVAIAADVNHVAEIAPEEPVVPFPRAKAPQPSPPPAPVREELPQEAARLDEVRQLADAGQCADALEKARSMQDGRAPSPSLLYYIGLLETECGSDLRAEDAYRSALYLDHGFAMAHYQMGLLLSRQGRIADARRAIGNAARLAAARPAHEILPESDGLSAAALYAIARQVLAGQWQQGGDA